MDIEMEIDNKVYEWFKTKQTKFKRHETQKIMKFNIEVIEFLKSLRPILTLPMTNRTFMEYDIISQKIEYYTNLNYEIIAQNNQEFN